MARRGIKAGIGRLPGGAAALAHWRWLRSPRARPTLRLIRHHGLAVGAGPFRGLRYPKRLVARVPALGARLVGSYECELREAVELLIERRPALVVNLGSAEGYYAVGMALRCPEAAVVAYELDPRVARACRALAHANGVEGRVEVRGAGGPAALARLDGPPGTAVICDCEGAEASLVDPEAVPWLAAAALVVELHEWAAPGVESLLRERLGGSHELERVATAPRYPSHFELLESTPGLRAIDKALLLTELRPRPMAWLTAIPRS